jgi:hypothetical protein
MFILFAVGLFVTMISGMKTITYLVSNHAAMGRDKYAIQVEKVNIGIILTSACATMTMVFHHFI